MNKAYLELETHQKKLAHLSHLGKILNWDEETMMPLGAGAARAESMSVYSVMLHEMRTRPDLGDLIEAAKAKADSLDDWQTRNLKIIEKSFRLSSLIPADLVKRRTEATMKCQQAWRQLRGENNFKSLEPLLDQVIQLSRESAQIIGDAQGLSPYDALLDQFEEGLNQRIVDPIFNELEAFLPSFIDEIIEQQKSETVLPLSGPFSIEKQRATSIQLMKKIGFDFERGRLDVSVHPFCGGDPSDVRITTRYDESDFSSALMGVLHETGHALYEQNLPEQWRRQPVGQSLGMSLHESQSLFLEMQVCRSPSFLKFAHPLLVESFKNPSASEEEWSLENLGRIYSRVQKSLIRVDADEVTYPLHIILRYKIEKDLMSGRLKTSDLPERWNQEMENSLGLTTKGNDKDGVMQDVHWPWGAFGYFPSYSLGAIIAASLFEAVKTALPSIHEKISQGEFSEMMTWLGENIHQRASSVTTWQILKDSTGKDLSTSAFLKHLSSRYRGN